MEKQQSFWFIFYLFGPSIFIMELPFLTYVSAPQTATLEKKKKRTLLRWFSQNVSKKFTLRKIKIIEIMLSLPLRNCLCYIDFSLFFAKKWSKRTINLRNIFLNWGSPGLNFHLPFLPRIQDSFLISVIVDYCSGIFSNSNHCQILL